MTKGASKSLPQVDCAVGHLLTTAALRINTNHLEGTVVFGTTERSRSYQTIAIMNGANLIGSETDWLPRTLCPVRQLSHGKYCCMLGNGSISAPIKH